MAEPSSGAAESPDADRDEVDPLILDELPPGLDVLWGRRERGRTGPKPSLRIEQIVDTAVRLADSEGLAAVSMARLARELGFTTMSLYRYVRSKDELHNLMWNSSATGLPAISGTGWRELLSDWAEQQRTALLTRPWLLELPVIAPPAGPVSMAWVEQAIAALGSTPLTELEKLSIVGMMSTYTLGDARLNHQSTAHAQATGRAEPDYGALIRTVVNEREYPALYRLAWSAELTARPDPNGLPPGVDVDLLGFRFGIDCILDGVQKLIERRSAGS